MPRKVPVALELQAAQYLAEARKVEASTKVMDAQMGALDRAVDKVDRDMAELAVTTEAAKRQVDDLGDKSRGTAVDLSLLDARIKATKLSVRELGLEFARTGDKAAGTQLGRERSLLARLEKLRKELSDLEQAATVGGGGITLPGGHGVMSVAAPAIAAALPALFPIGAMVSGLVVGTVGGGGILGGVIAAGHDSRVQAAWKSFTSGLTKESFGSEAFVEPTIKGIETLKAGLAGLHLGDVLAQGAPAVDTLAHGVVSFAKGVLPGFDAAMKVSDRTSHIFADGLSDVGASFGEMIRDLADKEGTMDGLTTAFHALDSAVKVTHATVGFLTDGFEALLGPSYSAAKTLEAITVIPGLRHFFHDQAAEIHNMRTNTADLVPHLEHMSNVQLAVNAGLDPFVGYLRDATNRTNEFAGALSELFKGQLDVDGATLAWKQDVLDLTEQVKQHGRSLADNTQDGLRNQQMIRGLVQDAMAVREATRQQTGSTDLANQAYMRQIKILEDLLQRLGFTKAQIQALVGTYEINVKVNVTGGGTLSRVLKNLAQEDRLTPHAAGGPLLPGVPYLVGERGPEIAMFGQSGQMYSNQQSAAMARPWQGSGGGAQVVRHEHVLDVRVNGSHVRDWLITDAVNRGQRSEIVSAAYP